MATQPDFQDDDDTPDLTEDMVVDDEHVDDGDVDQQDDDDAPPAFDDEPEQGTDLVRHLRAQLRDSHKRLAETRRQQPSEPEIVVGPRPKLADFDYDEEKFDAALDEWEDSKAQKAQRDSAASQQQARQQQEWQRVEEAYETKARALRYHDAGDALSTAQQALSPLAQAIIKKHADDPATLMYALGKSQSRMASLEALEAETGGDPMALTKALIKMEATLTNKPKTPRPPEPDRRVQGKAISSGSADKTLERLEKEAERTGDRTKIIAHKRAMKEKK